MGFFGKPTFTPDYGGGLPGANQPFALDQIDTHGLENGPRKKSGFFSKGGAWRDVLGALGDAFSDNGPMYAQGQMQQRNQAFEQQQAQMKAQQEEQTWREREDYKRQNESPYRFRANNGSMMEVGPDGKPREIYHDPDPRMQWAQGFDANGNPALVPQSVGGAQSSGYDDLPPGYTIRQGGQPSGAGGFPG
jgi:hypothetical protein